jgi:hypothetical protein
MFLGGFLFNDIGGAVQRLLLFLLIACWGGGAYASIASSQYVDTAVSTRVDTSESANQTMAGSYTVSGELIVPTQPLPEPK